MGWFTTDQYLGFIRHLLTVGGGALVTKGILTEQSLTQIVGAVMTLLGFLWSLIANQGSPVTVIPGSPTTVAPASSALAPASNTAPTSNTK